MKPANHTPMLQQYFEMREQHPEALLAMRVGDFYEFYGTDAETAAEALDISLTGREDGPNGRVAMAGVPFHSVEKYLAKLLAKGMKVALCDQLEDPRLAKKLVKRGITRVLTPGTLLEDSMLSGAQNNYLCACSEVKDKIGIATLDAATGEFACTEIQGIHRIEAFSQELSRLRPSELILVGDFDAAIEAARSLRIPTTMRAPIRIEDSEAILNNHFGSLHLDGFGIAAKKAAISAAAAIFNYAKHVQLELKHVQSIQVYDLDSCMKMDAATRRALDLTKTFSEGESGNDFTLLKVLDSTLTAMGKRTLSKWIEQPLLDRQKIEERLDAVERFLKHPAAREGLRSKLKGLGDLERPLSRCCTGSASPLDLAAIRRILLAMPGIDDALRLVSLGTIQQLRERIGNHRDLALKLKAGLAENPSANLREGNVIRPGFDETLDQTRRISLDAKEFMAALETKERAETGISSLKIGFNNVFGYYLETPKRFVDQVPNHYVRKQTTATSERYITAELKEQESIVLNAADRALAMEVELFQGLRDEIASEVAVLQTTAHAIGELDVLCSFAETAVQRLFTKPEIVDEDCLELDQARHPVVEAASQSFIPNDLCLGAMNPEDGESAARAIVLTGPNMAGKSTYLRQVALCVIMAQMGSFVPANRCKLGLCDRIFARIGARDELAAGQSTFMVEMLESANILNNATDRSLVILDEIGRGTATYDGLAIAWAMMEQLVAIGSKTLFATHYHQLNELAKSAATVRNFRVSVEEVGEKVIWTHQVVPGGADRSYGIQVAQMAGVPKDVLARAGEILTSLEGSEPSTPTVVPQHRKMQYSLFEMQPSAVEKAIQGLDINRLSPMEALEILDRLQRQIRTED